MNYIGNHCPVCEKKFAEGDDIVVCPDCGTPYHRECWAKVGACMHKSEHAAGFEWKPDFVPEEKASATCPNCGNKNPADAQYCNRCGKSLPNARASGQNPRYQRDTAGSSARSQREPRIEAYAAGPEGIYRRELGPDDCIDGIKARDWASFIGRSSLFYLIQFFRMSQTKRRAGFSAAALLLGPIYFFYRKMWKKATLFAVLDVLCSLPVLLYYLKLTESALTVGLSTSLLVNLMNVAGVLSWVLRFVMALFAFYWYKQEATARINSICAATTDETTKADALAMSGGTSLFAVLLYLLAYVVLSLALGLLSGPNLAAAAAAFL